MPTPFFVLGIGGTGMRCIESLIHLCAMGMFDDTEIHLLALDTDKNNGNFSRLKEVKEAYCNAKGSKEADRVALSNTFFSANLKYYEFSPNYEQKSTFRAVFGYDDTRYNNHEEADLADLVFSKNVQDFNLRHGYRAQTHLGSMMMYHSIIEAAQSPLDNDLKRFLSRLNTAAQNGKPRVFILGSVFGGTGASSIPIIPQAISQAAGIISNGVANVLSNAYFGSTLLTAYFNFKTPNTNELSNQKVIATCDKFALNSQVAMMFYKDDKTVTNTYQKFYMLGTSSLDWDPMQKKSGKITETITGGEQQKNDSHYIELLAACAALNFYRMDESQLKDNKAQNHTDYLYRAIDENGKLDFQDFVGKDRAKEFAQKFGSLIAFALFCIGEDNFVESVQSGDQKEIQEFRDMDVTQVTSLYDYFNLFFVKKLSDKTLQEGWLGQLHRSAGGSDSFLFNAALFSPSNEKKLKSFDWNNELYRTEGIGKDHKYSKTGVLSKSKFDPFKKMFITVRDGQGENWKNITNTGEKLYKLMFDTLAKLYRFN